MTAQRRIVVVGAAYGAGHEDVADALADAFRRHPSASSRVLQMDLLGRCAPRAVGLAAMAWRGGEPFFPDGSGTLSEMAAGSGEDPLVRELISGGVASAEATLRALEPDVVVTVHPAAGGLAAEVSERCGCQVVTVLPDLMPDRLWIHPRVGMWCVAGPDARDELARRQVDWSRIVVTGVPQAAVVSRAGATARSGAGHQAPRMTALVSGIEHPAALSARLRASGFDVLLETAGDRRSAATPAADGGAGAARADLLAKVDLVVSGRCGSLVWQATAAGVPLLVVGVPGAMERASVDLLVDAGAALPARDEADGARRAAYLISHPDRLREMGAAALGLGRPLATKAVCERVLALVR